MGRVFLIISSCSHLPFPVTPTTVPVALVADAAQPGRTIEAVQARAAAVATVRRDALRQRERMARRAGLRQG